MVIPGIRSQGTGIRVIAVLLINIFFLGPITAKDFGTHGIIYPIEEVDPIAQIQQKLKAMEGSGELTQRNREIQKRTRAFVERPKAAEGITKATRVRVFTYDPTYEVKEDLYDQQGRIFAKKGSKINPLETINLSQKLIFFNGDDPGQVVWVKEQFDKSIKNNSIRLILIQGAPLELSEELGIPVYFDQSGVLTKKLGIRHVPAVVIQEDKRLRIEEIKLLKTPHPTNRSAIGHPLPQGERDSYPQGNTFLYHKENIANMVRTTSPLVGEVARRAGEGYLKAQLTADCSAKGVMQ